MTLAEGYTVGVDITTGVGLGLNLGDLTASFTASVTISQSNTTTYSGGKNCPAGNYICALTYTPSVLQVMGHVDAQDIPYNDANGCAQTTTGDYTVLCPVIYPQANAPVGTVGYCACPNKPGWDTPGAPSKCPSDCSTA
mgnify:CR=1 FL=1